MTAAMQFLRHLHLLDVPVWTAQPGGNEYVRPNGWQSLTSEGNGARVGAHQPGHAFGGNMGGRVAAVDVDTKNGANIEQIMATLDGIGCRVYAEIVTPSGGRHLYVAGHPDLPTVHAHEGRDGLLGHPGVEIISYGANVFLPGTLRAKYAGEGYVIVSDELDVLADGGDEDSAEALAAWVGSHRVTTAATFEPAPPWDGATPDARQRAYLEAAVSRQVEQVAAMGPDSGRNVAVYTAGLKLGNFVAGAGLDEADVAARLLEASTRNGLVGEDGERAVLASIRSGLRNGRNKPKAVPEAPPATALLPDGNRVNTTTGELLDGPQEAADSAVEAALAFNRDTADELRKLRVREAARELLRAEKEPDAPPFDIGTIAEVMARPDEPPMRAAGLIPWEASSLIVAQRKVGKTTLTFNYAQTLLTGGAFLGRFEVVPIEGTVALLNYEVSARTLARWAREHAVDEDRLVTVNLRGRRNPLSHPQDRQRLADALKARGVESMIVDPFGRAFTGTSQNDAGEVGSFLTDLDRFARAEVGARDLMLTTHAGWDGERTRGSSALEDWADVIITMTKDEETDDRFIRAVGRDVELDEDRLNFDGATRTLSLSGGGSRKKSRDDKKVSELAVFVVRAARQKPGSSGRQIEAAIKDMDDAPTFRNGEVSKAAKFAAEQGHLRIEVGGNGRQSKHHAVDLEDVPKPQTANRSQPLPTAPREHLLTAPTAPIGGAVAVRSVEDGTDPNGNGPTDTPDRELSTWQKLLDATPDTPPCSTCGSPLPALRHRSGYTLCRPCEIAAEAAS